MRDDIAYYGNNPFTQVEATTSIDRTFGNPAMVSSFV